MFWRRQDSPLRPRTCFYCNTTTDVIKDGRRSLDWTCPSCDALNILDDNGQLRDTIPESYQRVQDATSSSIHSDRVASLATPFCSICTSNHALLVKMLASYLPEDDHEDISVYEKALPVYKASLEERYPPLCSACAPNVQKRLERNNYLAKSTALGKWLIDSQAGSKTTGNNHRFLHYIKLIEWLGRGFIWWTTCYLMLTWYYFGVVSPANHKFGMDLQRDTGMGFLRPVVPFWPSQQVIANQYYLRKSWLPISFFGAFWNPRAWRTLSGSGWQLQNKAEYYELQLFILFLRCASIYILPLIDLNTNLHLRLHALLLALSLLHLVLSFHVSKVYPPQKFSMRNRSVDFSDLANVQESESKHEPQSDTMKHFEQVKFNRPVFPHHDARSTSGDNHDDDLMDWQESVSPDSTPRMSPFDVMYRADVNTTSPFTSIVNPVTRSMARSKDTEVPLARQRFFAPEKPTGLENLFTAAIRLDDEPLLVRSMKSITSAPILAKSWIFCSGSILALATLFYSTLAALVVSCLLSASMLVSRPPHARVSLLMSLALTKLCLGALHVLNSFDLLPFARHIHILPSHFESAMYFIFTLDVLVTARLVRRAVRNRRQDRDCKRDWRTGKKRKAIGIESKVFAVPRPA